VRLLLALCITLVCATVGLAENNSKEFVDGCNSFRERPHSYETGDCLGAMRTLMVVGPYLREDLKFCPDSGRAIFGMAAMNGYVKAHPDVLKPDTPNMDRVSLLILAFREEWPCK
jgi:hypothetical protein